MLKDFFNCIRDELDIARGESRSGGLSFAHSARGFMAELGSWRNEEHVTCGGFLSAQVGPLQRTQAGGAGNPKSEIRNPKQIQRSESRENRETRAGKFPRSLRASWAIAVQRGNEAEAVSASRPANRGV